MKKIDVSKLLLIAALSLSSTASYSEEDYILRDVKNCEKGRYDYCFNAGLEYSRIGEMGKARQYYQLACDHGQENACTNLGVLYEKGSGGPVDGLSAVELYKKACNLGEVKGCTNAAYLYAFAEAGVTKNHRAAAPLFEKACERAKNIPDWNMSELSSAAESCGYLGQYYEKGLGVEANYRLARFYYEKGCRMNFQSACKWLHNL